MKYKLDIFRPGCRIGRKPMLWRRHDIFAVDDRDAKLRADKLYQTYEMTMTLTSFYLCEETGRSVFQYSTPSSLG